MTIYVVGPANPTMRDADGSGAEALSKERTITKIYRSKANAERAAKALATKYPGELFGVYGITSLYEAKAPEVMEKVMNDRGEIVPKG